MHCSHNVEVHEGDVDPSGSMAADGGGDLHHVEDADADLQAAEEVARRAMLTPSRDVSEETSAASATAKDSDFSFTPVGAAAGPRVPTLKLSGTPDDEAERLPSAAVASTVGSIDRPASAEALEYMSATSGSEPLLETASAQPDTLAAGGTAAAAAVPSAAPPPATAAEEPAIADGSAATAVDGVAQPGAKAPCLVPKLPSIPARSPQDAFAGLPDDVLHGGDDRPSADASITFAAAATSIQEEPAAAPQGAGLAAGAQGQESAATDMDAEASSHSVAASPPAPAATNAEATSFAPQTPEVSQTEVLPPSVARPAAASGTANASQQAHLEYVSRDNQTPHMERKLRNLQMEDWEGSGGLGDDDKPALTRSQKEREEELQSWKHMDAQPVSDSAARAVQAVDVAPLGEDFKVHKSRLEQDVEEAQQRERTPPPSPQQRLPSYMRPTANSATRSCQSASSPRASAPANGHRSGASPTPPQGGLEAVMSRHQSALEAAKAGGAASVDYEAIKRAPPAQVPGLDELLADTGRIQRAREEAAQRHSELYRPVPKREAPKGPGLDEVLVISKSQLELEKEAAAKAAGTAGPSSPPPPPGSPADKARKRREAAAAEHIQRFRPAAPKPQDSDSFGGQGLGEVMLKHKSTLQRNKEEAEAAGANSPTAPLRSGSRSQMLAQRQEQEWGGRSLQELQRPHKSRLLREQEDWAKRAGTKPVSARKQITHTRHVTSPGEKPDAPSFMKDTMASTMKHIDIPEPPRTPGSS